MATTKKRSTPARKKPGSKRPATKKPARVDTSPKKAAAKKAVVPKKSAKAAPKRRASRSAKAVEIINPQQQLTKVLAETSAPSIARVASRGVGMPAGVGAPDGPTMPEGFFSAYTGATLTEQDYANAAQTLACEVAAVKAVAEVETAGASFDASNRPTILYERHVFSRCTAPPGKFDRTYPDLSASKPYPKGAYGSKDQQFVKLARAFHLDQAAALKAPSWGKFQILGENCKACGFATVADFVKAMTISETEHLKAFVKFLLSSPKRLQAIRKKDWAALALYYNGPNYAQFKYDTKLAAAYAKHAQSA